MVPLARRISLVLGLSAAACSGQSASPVVDVGSGGQGTGTGGHGSSASGGATAGPTASGGATGSGGGAQSSGGTTGIGGGAGGSRAGSGGGSVAVGTGGAAGASGVAGASGAAAGSTGVGDPGTAGDGDFTVGPTYTLSPDLKSTGAPVGRSFHFTMSSVNSIFTGMDSTLNTKASFTRGVDVYIPAKYRDGAAAPFLVIQDGPGQLGNVKLALDNLTQTTNLARRLPAFVAIAIQNGGGDSKGSERGLEYDTLSDRYARFVEAEVLPAVLGNAAIKAAFPHFALTSDPEGRATIGCSSGAAAAFTMGWFRADLYHRIVAYSATLVAQQNDTQPEKLLYPDGAWDYHSNLALIANSANKPLRIFINANQMDNGATAPASGMHNWLIANQRTAAALKAKGYHYRFVEGLGAGHCDGRVQDLTLPDTLLWVWRGYPTGP